MGRENKGIFIAYLAMLEYRAVNGIKECFRDFEIVMSCNQPRIYRSRLPPELEIMQLLACNQFHILVDLGGFFLVQIDTLDGGMPNTVPVRIFKTRFGCQRDILEFSKI